MDLSFTLRLTGEAPVSEPTPATEWRDDQGRVAAFGTTTGPAHWMRMPGLGTFHWRDDSDVVTVASSSPEIEPDVLQDTFQRCVLPMALSTRGCQVLHASGVLGPDGVVALCARSQTGKSTLARGLGGRPARAVWADDAVAFACAPDGALAIPLPFSLSLRRRSAAYFAAQADPALSADAAPAPLAAVVLLERASGAGDPPVSFERLRPAEAFTAVLAHAYCFDGDAADRRREVAEQYLELVARVPVLTMRFRTGFELLPGILDELERALAVSVDGGA